MEDWPCLVLNLHSGLLVFCFADHLSSWSDSDMKSERRPPSPDVIVLSDSEQPSSPRVNGLTTAALKDTSTEALLVSLCRAYTHWELDHLTSAEPVLKVSPNFVLLLL